MAITAWAIVRWVGTGVTPDEYRAGGGAGRWLDLTNTDGRNIPPGINVSLWRRDGIPDKAALDALDATPGVIVLSAVNDDGTRVTGYLRPQDAPTGPQLVTARNRLQAAGVPLGELTTRVQVGMTMAQIADTMRDYAHDLRKANGQAAQAAKQIG